MLISPPQFTGKLWRDHDLEPGIEVGYERGGRQFCYTYTHPFDFQMTPPSFIWHLVRIMSSRGAGCIQVVGE